MTQAEWAKILIPLIVAVSATYGGQELRIAQVQDQKGAYQWRAEECIAIWKALDEVAE